MKSVMKSISSDQGVFTAPSERATGQWATWRSIKTDSGWVAIEGERHYHSREDAEMEARKSRCYQQKIAAEIESL